MPDQPEALENAGIVHVYDKGENIDSMEKAILTADELCLFTITANGFMQNLEKVIEQRLKSKKEFEMRLLLADSNTDYVKVLQIMEDQDKTYAKSQINYTYVELDRLYRQSCHQPRFQIKQYDTVFRNHVILCRRNNQIECWVTLVMPHKQGKESPMFEMDDYNSRLYYQFFNELWEGDIFDKHADYEKYKCKDYKPPEGPPEDSTPQKNKMPKDEVPA